MPGPHVRIRLDFSRDCAVGPGKIALLEGIARAGSLSAAARELGMSYRRGWMLVQELNSGFDSRLVELSVGGRAGGGARLTPLGERMVKHYRSLEAKVDRLAMKDFGSFRPAKYPAR